MNDDIKTIETRWIAIDEGLHPQPKLIVYALAVSAGLAPVAHTSALAKPSAAMPVSVIVLATTQLRMEHQETQLTITAADVARGYVDVTEACRFVVQTNSHAGYQLQFSPIGSLFASAQVAGLSHPVQFGPDGGSIVQRGSVVQALAHALSFRFALHADTQPGVHHWPLHIAVRAL